MAPTSSTNLTSGSHQPRSFVVFAGELEWGKQHAEQWCSNDTVLLTSKIEASPPWLTPKDGKKMLGTTVGNIIYDVHSGFDPDFLALIAGSINGGFSLVLLTPNLETWAQQSYYPVAKRFLSRFIRKLKDHNVSLYQQKDNVVTTKTSPPSVVNNTQKNLAVSHPDCKTKDQQRAVNLILSVVSGHRRRPLVLLSDRGRGKSTALGIAAADLISQSGKRIIITAPRLAAVSAVFETLNRRYPNAEHRQGRCHHNGSEVIFLPPDHLFLCQENTDLLMIDEAAAIPASLLYKLLKRYSRIVFSTTQDGYEGSGRGFAIRFNEILNKEAPGWKQFELLTPIRWSQDDPLEQFIFDALLLKSKVIDSKQLVAITTSNTKVVRLDRDKLVHNEKMLAELFGLLILAHYQTSANDLRQLLDDPEVMIYALLSETNHLLATALVTNEGPLDASITPLIKQGKRRLNGQLTPQSLVAHVGIEAAAELRYRRILRITTHPDLQSQGFGSRLLDRLKADATEEGIDCLATSFGVSNRLLSFWRQSNFSVVKIGTKRNAASARYSTLMLLPISAQAKRMNKLARTRFTQTYTQLLGAELSRLDAGTAIALAHSFPAIKPDAAALALLDEFARSNLALIAALPELLSLATYLLSSGEEQSWNHQIIVMKLIQRYSWDDLANHLNINGKHAAQQQFRNAVRQTLLEID